MLVYKLLFLDVQTARRSDLSFFLRSAAMNLPDWLVERCKMEAIAIAFYVLFGIGCYIGYHPDKLPSVLDVFEVLTWPVTLGVLVVASLKKYLEIE